MFVDLFWLLLPARVAMKLYPREWWVVNPEPGSRAGFKANLIKKLNELTVNLSMKTHQTLAFLLSNKNLKKLNKLKESFNETNELYIS